MSQQTSKISRLQKVLDAFHGFRRGLHDCLCFLSMRFFGFEATYKDVQSRTWPNVTHVDRNLDNADSESLEQLLKCAECEFKDAADRRTLLTDKCKTLLGLASSLLALLGIFSPKFNVDTIVSQVLFFLTVLALLNSVSLLLYFFGVGPEAVVKAELSETNLGIQDLQKSLINKHYAAIAAKDNRTDFLVNVYEVARFFFLIALVLLTIAFSINIFSKKPEQSKKTDEIMRELRSQPELIEMLRGPRGNKGEKGEKGERGELGLPGRKIEATPLKP